MLGILLLIVALFHFLQMQRRIEEERYQLSPLFPIVLTCLAALIGLLLAVSLTFTT